jgi:hypothetical protein
MLTSPELVCQNSCNNCFGTAMRKRLSSLLFLLYICRRELETCFLFVNMSRKQLGDHADNSQKFICSASVKQNLLLLGISI